MKYGFLKQVQQICHSLSYLTFGINLKPVYPSQLDSTSYKSDISARIYDSYRKDQFKYADSGITPKMIAQEIQIHMKVLGDLQWQIDGFGNINFSPSKKYLKEIRQNMLEKKKYEHTPLAEWSRQGFISKDKHYFDFILTPQLSISQLRRLVYMETIARSVQAINKQFVHRSIYVDKQNKPSFIQKICQILFKGNFKISYMEELKVGNRFQDKNNIIEYVACDPSQTIQFQRLFPRHQIINMFMGSEQTKVEAIEEKKLLKELQKRPKGKLQSFNEKKLFLKQISVEETILIFGNLLDFQQFQAAKNLIIHQNRVYPEATEIKMLESTLKTLFPLDLNI